jgi:hypothetical protein
MKVTLYKSVRNDGAIQRRLVIGENEVINPETPLTAEDAINFIKIGMSAGQRGETVEFATVEEKIVEEDPHIVTEEDIENNPELTEEGVAPGDEITIPVENQTEQ